MVVEKITCVSTPDNKYMQRNRFNVETLFLSICSLKFFECVVPLADHADFVVLCSCALSLTFYILHYLI